MRFMISGQHAFKIACGSLSDSAEIDMYEHEKGNNESCKNVKKIGQMKTADTC